MAELYHVLNRGVEKRAIVMDDQDRARFVHDLFEFTIRNRLAVRIIRSGIWIYEIQK